MFGDFSLGGFFDQIIEFLTRLFQDLIDALFGGSNS